jgi:DNA polymerase I
MKKYEIIYSTNQLVDYLENDGGFLDKNPLVAFDTETTGLSAFKDTLLGISLYNKKIHPAFIVVQTPYFDGIPIEEARMVLNPYFEKMEGLAHNGKFDLLVFKVNGFSQINLKYDSSLGVYVYDPNLKKKLETRVKEDLKIPKKTYEEIIGKKWKNVKWKEDIKKGIITIESLGKYACEDVHDTYLLWEHYKPKLEREGNLMKVLCNIEVPLTNVLVDMKMRGIRVDVPFLNNLAYQVADVLETTENAIYDSAGCYFNINSSKQKAQVLYDKLGYKCPKTTKTGNRATDVVALEFLAAEGCETADFMLSYSGLQKLDSGYIRAIPKMVDKDGRLRCEFNSDGARTGRMSSEQPNLQNQPNNKDFPVRKAFVPTEGYKFVILDWSQIELRIMAHCAKDQRLMKAFWNGEDIHGAVSSDLGIERKQAKTINFGVLYGMGPDKLARSLGVTVQRARQIIDAYNRTYSGYSKWKRQVENYARSKGYVKTVFGRVRRLPAARNENDRGAFFGALRQAVNTSVQGSAADLMKIGMLKMHKMIQEEKLDAHLLLVVHDEFVCEAKEHVPGRLYHLEECYDKIKKVMEHSVKLAVPIVADGKVCDNWSQMKDDDYISLLERPQIEIPRVEGFDIMDLLKLQMN